MLYLNLSIINKNLSYSIIYSKNYTYLLRTKFFSQNDLTFLMPIVSQNRFQSRQTFLYNSCINLLHLLNAKQAFLSTSLQLTYDFWNLFWHILSHCVLVAWRKNHQLYIMPSSETSQKGSNHKHPSNSCFISDIRKW